MAQIFKYAATNETPVYESVSANKGVKVINRLLMGTYAAIITEDGDFVKVQTAGPDGWINKADLSDNMGLKVFYLDVGQGDGVLIEVGKYKILIDAGPANNMSGYLTKWQYTYLLKEKLPIHIDYLFVSHFDADHFKGFIPILENPAFTFGTIFHGGILKFASTDTTYKSGLGDLVKKDGKTYLTKVFDNLLITKETVPFNRDVSTFMEALKKAAAEKRVNKVRRLKAGDIPIIETIEGNIFKIEALAPFTEKINNKISFLYWTDEGVTINGHSLVLKIHFGQRTLLLGGDLNSQSETYLMEKYAGTNPFEVDVAKACHHGSSDFTTDFMQQVNPYATVISSGDNEGFSHPRADAIGCAGKYSKGTRPLVYSTELARSVNMKSGKILFGMINLRCNGNDIFISQMKEVKKSSDLWDSYSL
jgi:beta-lactamase superfamily II metal-dependent hydrolase